MLSYLVLFSVLGMGIGSVYFLMTRGSLEGEYIWVGPGRNPFKK